MRSRLHGHPARPIPSRSHPKRASHSTRLDADCVCIRVGEQVTPYPPLLERVGVTYGSGSPTFTLAGSLLDRVAAASLVQEGAPPVPLIIAHQEASAIVLQSHTAPTSESGYLEVRDAAGFTSALALSTTDLGVDEQWDATHVLVRFRPGMIDPPAQLTEGLTASFQASSSTLLDALTGVGVIRLERLLPWFRHEDVHSFNQLGQPVTLEDMADLYVAHLAPNTDVTTARDQLLELPEVFYACRDLTTGAYNTIPNDPYFAGGPQWGLRNQSQTLCGVASGFSSIDIGAVTAWDRTTGSPSIKIAILDSGIDNVHPDMFPVAVLDTSLVPGQSPYDFSLSRHGTAVAGIAAAYGNDNFGVTGVGWSLTPVAVKIFDSNTDPPGGTIAWMGQGIDRARVKGYPICNISGGFPAGPGSPPPSAADTKALNDLCYNAYVSGVFIVAAMGNTVCGPDDLSDPQFNAYPARFSQRVFSVGAMQPDDARWRDQHFWPLWCAQNPGLCGASNYGAWMDALAPGGRFIVTDRCGPAGVCSGSPPDTFYQIRSCNSTNPNGSGFSGTSAAAPFASGIAGLLKSYALGFIPPVNLTNDDVEQVLKKTSAYYGDTPPFDVWEGYGNVRASVALNFIAPPKTIVQDYLYAGKPLASLVVQGDSTSFASRTFINVPGLPTSSYTTSGWVIHLKGTARHGGFISTPPPSVWVRAAATQGWRDTSMFFDYGYEVPWAKITSLGTDSTTFETCVYRILVSGTYQYFPVAPPQARIAFTAVGEMGTTGVDEQVLAGRFDVQTSPNPSVRGVWLAFSLPRKGALRASIVDLAGRTVAVIAEGMREGGRLRLRWDGLDLGGNTVAPGMYWCKVEFDGTRLSRRFVLLGH